MKVMKIILAGVCFAIAASASAAHAQTELADRAAVRPDVNSPERFALELRVGPYTPEIDNSAGEDIFARVFDDQGPLLAVEFDVQLYRLKDVGMVGLGFGFGWSSYSANALVQGTTEASSEETDLTLLPLNAMAVLRIDALPRLFNVPIIFAGKLGLDSVVWSSSTGNNSVSNISLGLRWAVQVALELDFFERRAARALDEEWGINHSFVFVEFFGSTASSTLPVGPRGGVAWTAGLGFIL